MHDLTREKKEAVTWSSDLWVARDPAVLFTARCKCSTDVSVLYCEVSSLFPSSLVLSHQKIPLWFRLAHDMHSLLSSCLFSIAAPHSHPDTYLLLHLFSWMFSSAIPFSLLVDSCGKSHLSWMSDISKVWLFGRFVSCGLARFHTFLLLYNFQQLIQPELLYLMSLQTLCCTKL